MTFTILFTESYNSFIPLNIDVKYSEKSNSIHLPEQMISVYLQFLFNRGN